MKTKNFLSKNTVNQAYLSMYFFLQRDYEHHFLLFTCTNRAYRKQHYYAAKQALLNLRYLRSQFKFIKKAPF